jgi:hypothetical protein
MVGDSFLSDAGWVFFAAWSVIVAVVSLAALGRDLLPSRMRLKLPPEARPIDPARARESGGH